MSSLSLQSDSSKLGITSFPLYQSILSYLERYPYSYFTAGIGIAFLGNVTTILNRIYYNLANYVQSHLFTSMELNSRDESYTWLMEWINIQPWAQLYRKVTVNTTYNSSNDELDNQPVIMYLPDVGSHMISYKGHRIWMTRTRDESRSVDTLAHYGIYENLILRSWRNNRLILQDIIQSARDLYLLKERGKTIIYTSSHGSWQRQGLPRATRPMESVILPSDLKSHLCHDVHEFMNSSSWYSLRGIPYRRGYLFHGPPGTGKTSLVLAIAGHLGMNICSINLNTPDMTDDHLVTLLNKTPGKRCILLIEDIDAAFPVSPRDSNQYQKNGMTHENNNNRTSPSQYDQKTHPSRSLVSFSGLLNALDGISSQEGRLLFMTTNHVHHLDSALYRPGRIDVKFDFTLTNTQQLREIFEIFYPDQMELSEKFATQIPKDKYTMAEIQSYLIQYKKDPFSALDNIDSL